MHGASAASGTSRPVCPAAPFQHALTLHRGPFCLEEGRHYPHPEGWEGPAGRLQLPAHLADQPCRQAAGANGSVLGLLLGQGAEWKIQTGSQHKEWINMTPK